MNLVSPAMSRTLARIRETVGDPIFVQAGRKMGRRRARSNCAAPSAKPWSARRSCSPRPRKSISARSTSSSTCARTTSSSACTAAACSRRWRAGCRARCCASCPRKTTSTTTRCAAAASTCSSARRRRRAGDSRPAVHDDPRRPRARRSPDLDDDITPERFRALAAHRRVAARQVGGADRRRASRAPSRGRCCVVPTPYAAISRCRHRT